MHDACAFTVRSAWIAGAFPGLFGGLVGNQGGIRLPPRWSASICRKRQFVATATAIALFVDGARLPVYLVTHGDQIANLWRPIAIASLGVVAGTLIGSRALTRIPEVWFRRILAVVLWLLGITMIVRGLAA